MTGVRVLTDVTPLRAYPAYRRLWLGMMLSRITTAARLKVCIG